MNVPKMCPKTQNRYRAILDNLKIFLNKYSFIMTSQISVIDYIQDSGNLHVFAAASIDIK